VPASYRRHAEHRFSGIYQGAIGNTAIGVAGRIKVPPVNIAASIGIYRKNIAEAMGSSGRSHPYNLAPTTVKLPCGFEPFVPPPAPKFHSPYNWFHWYQSKNIAIAGCSSCIGHTKQGLSDLG